MRRIRYPAGPSSSSSSSSATASYQPCRAALASGATDLSEDFLLEEALCDVPGDGNDVFAALLQDRAWQRRKAIEVEVEMEVRERGTEDEESDDDDDDREGGRDTLSEEGESAAAAAAGVHDVVPRPSTRTNHHPVRSESETQTHPSQDTREAREIREGDSQGRFAREMHEVHPGLEPRKERSSSGAFSFSEEVASSPMAFLAYLQSEPYRLAQKEHQERIYRSFDVLTGCPFVPTRPVYTLARRRGHDGEPKRNEKPPGAFEPRPDASMMSFEDHHDHDHDDDRHGAALYFRTRFPREADEDELNRVLGKKKGTLSVSQMVDGVVTFETAEDAARFGEQYEMGAGRGSGNDHDRRGAETTTTTTNANANAKAKANAKANESTSTNVWEVVEVDAYGLFRTAQNAGAVVVMIRNSHTLVGGIREGMPAPHDVAGALRGDWFHEQARIRQAEDGD